MATNVPDDSAKSREILEGIADSLASPHDTVSNPKT
jgi:hypothetical protein